jgi:hypothetical protein
MVLEQAQPVEQRSLHQAFVGWYRVLQTGLVVALMVELHQQCEDRVQSYTVSVTVLLVLVHQCSAQHQMVFGCVYQQALSE